MSSSQATPCTATRAPQCLKGLPGFPAGAPRPAAWSAACLRDRALESALEQAVAERTAALEQSNRELDAFARDLAHEMARHARAWPARMASLVALGIRARSKRGRDSAAILRAAATPAA